MKTSGLKFNQNRAIKEEFYFWGQILSGGPKGKEWTNLKKSLYGTVVLTHIQNVSLLAELESV